MGKRIVFVPLLVAAAFFVVSCSEESDDTVEFVNWQATNEAYFDSIYAVAEAAIVAGDDTYKILRSWDLEESVAEDNYDYVVVQVITEGTGSGCPLYTDSVKVHYDGRLLPSTSYPNGYMFDQSYYDEFNAATSLPALMAVSALVDGMCTALQYMHIGDRWRIIVPHQLGYGSENSSSIPAYSTLIFETELVSYFRAGVEVPDSKAKASGTWIEE